MIKKEKKKKKEKRKKKRKRKKKKEKRKKKKKKKKGKGKKKKECLFSILEFMNYFLNFLYFGTCKWVFLPSCCHYAK